MTSIHSLQSELSAGRILSSADSHTLRTLIFMTSSLFLIVVGICPFISAVVIPPKPKESCASTEYSVLQQNGVPSQTIGSTTPIEDRTPIVVEGRSPFNTTNEIKIGQQITVCAMGLYHWLYVNKKPPADLRLMIGGNLLEGLRPSVGPPQQEYVNFVLEMDTADSPDWKAWAAIVDSSRRSQKHQLSVTLAHKGIVFESNTALTISAYPKRWQYFVLPFLSLLAILLYLASRTDLLRFTVGEHPIAPMRSPFSLGLVQMAFWFYLVLAAYIYICVITQQVHIPMGSVLGLLGISASTGLAAIAVDKRKIGSAQNDTDGLIAEQLALNARIAELIASNPAAGSSAEVDLRAKQDRLAQVNAQLKQVSAAPPLPTSKGFIADILKDGDGVSFHRFQIAVWTLVLGAVFVWSVYRSISMPEFDASLLTLMGISSGTYVGFKFPEKLKT